VLATYWVNYLYYRCKQLLLVLVTNLQISICSSCCSIVVISAQHKTKDFNALTHRQSNFQRLPSATALPRRSYCGCPFAYLALQNSVLLFFFILFFVPHTFCECFSLSFVLFPMFSFNLMNRWLPYERETYSCNSTQTHTHTHTRTRIRSRIRSYS